MTKKDYKLIASLLRKHADALYKYGQFDFPLLIDDFVCMLEKDNKNFNADKFIDFIQGK